MINTKTQEGTLFEKALERLDHRGAIKANRNGQRTITTRCPAHDDNEPSLSVTEFDDDKIGLKCFSGCEYHDIMNALGLGNVQASAQSIAPTKKKKTKKAKEEKIKLLPLAIDEFAETKGFTVSEYGQLNALGIEQKRYKGHNAVHIPYFMADGSTANRTRYRLKKVNDEGEVKTAYFWSGAGDIVPYGLKQLANARDKGYMFLVEGETDCLTLWLHGFPALGVPGASLVSCLKSEHVEGIHTLYVMNEKDDAAKKFIKDASDKLREIGWSGELYHVTMPDEIKDPNELHLKLNDYNAFVKQIETVKDQAKAISIQAEQEVAATSNVIPLPMETDVKLFADRTLGSIFSDLPEEIQELEIPKGWTLDEKGVGSFKQVKVGQEIDFEWYSVSRSPILISRYVDRKNGELSKVELMFQYRGKWTSLLANRGEIASQTQIVKLADKKLPVTSVNAKQIVAFLDAFEAENEHQIPHKESLNHLGWADKECKVFISDPNESPYFLDLEPSLRETAEAIHAKGSLADWVTGMNPYIATEDYEPVLPVCRAVIASYFASPLLDLLKQRSFVLHLFSNSGGGKTAVNYLGASVWGNPEDLKTMLDSTKFSIESRAGLFKNLPMFTDELQSISRQKQTDTAEQLLYMISNNRGRERGNKDGGLREAKTWRLIMNTTGERPLTETNSQGGAKNRALEIYGNPIPDKAIAKKAYRVAMRNYGTAGPYFISKVLEMRKKTIQKYYDDIAETIESHTIDADTGNSPQHITMVSILCLADFLASQWVFGKEEHEAIAEAYNLGVSLLGSIESSSNIDDSERARDYIESWFFMNRDHFNSERYNLPAYGWIAKNKKEICIMPPVFSEALKEGGFDPTRTLKDWLAKGWIESEKTRGKIKRVKPETKQRVYVVAIKYDVIVDEKT